MTTPKSAPCPCGSGLKYKRCHGSEFPPEGTPEDIAWSSLRRAIDGLQRRMLQHAVDSYGRRCILDAWDCFMLWADDAEPFHPDNPNQTAFVSWFLHKWFPAQESDHRYPEALQLTVPARAFLDDPSQTISAPAREYVEACLAGAFSFYEIVRVDEGHGFRLRDVFTKEEFEVHERSGTEVTKKGDMLFALLATAGGVTVAEGIGGSVLTPAERIRVQEFAEQTPPLRAATHNADLAVFDIEMREQYLWITDEIDSHRQVELRNTDGDELDFQLIHYDIDSPNAAYAALRHLAHGHSNEDMEGLLKRDGSGAIMSAEFPWLRPSENAEEDDGLTVLAHIRLERSKMQIEVNSKVRADTIMAIVRECLGEGARYTTTQRETLAEVQARQQRRAAGNAVGTRDEQLSIDSPDIRKHMEAILARHYERWTDESVPALGGKSPRESMSDPIGREKVRALVEQMELSPPPNVAADSYQKVMHKVRAELGLPLE